MSNADLIERLRHNPTLDLFAEAADALAAADKRIAELAEEITMLRAQHLYTCGTTHPEMYKTELDHAKERIAELEAERPISHDDWYALCNELIVAERKLAIAREALHFAVTMPRSFEANRRAAQALEQIS